MLPASAEDTAESGSVNLRWCYVPGWKTSPVSNGWARFRHGEDRWLEFSRCRDDRISELQLLGREELNRWPILSELEL